MLEWTNVRRQDVVVEHSMFCGRDSGLRIYVLYVHPGDMPRLLAAPSIR